MVEGENKTCRTRSPRTRVAVAALLAVGYLRVSTEDQKLGPEAQRASIEAWAAHAGVTIAAWHADQGVSGGADIGDRPALVAALTDLRVLGAGVLVVAKRDRIARDVYIARAVEKAVEACGASLVSAAGEGNGDTPADQFMRTILDGAAEYERALIRARTRAALGVLKTRGVKLGRLPEVATPELAARVRALRAAGHSLSSIARGLNAEGVPTPRGRTHWFPASVRHVLSTETA